MKCPFCGADKDNVIDSRKVEDGRGVRRRRECEVCGERYTTYERVEKAIIYVIKKNGGRIVYDRSKIESGIIRACNKRPIDLNTINDMVDSIEEEIYSFGTNEVSTDKIGEMILDRLRKIDTVAYIRFASVYKEFKDASEFINELNIISKE